MVELIRITKEPSLPRIACPHCGQHNFIDIKPFASDVSQIMKDNCKHCRMDIYVALLILGHRKHKLLLMLIKQIVDLISSPHKIIG
jgi:hypothetical protein